MTFQMDAKYERVSRQVMRGRWKVELRIANCAVGCEGEVRCLNYAAIDVPDKAKKERNEKKRMNGQRRAKARPRK